MKLTVGLQLLAKEAAETVGKLPVAADAQDCRSDSGKSSAIDDDCAACSQNLGGCSGAQNNGEKCGDFADYILQAYFSKEYL